MYARQNFYRLQHWQLAERQRYVADLEALVARLRTDVERMNGELEQASGDMDAASVPGVFTRPLINRRDKLQVSIAELDAQIAEARAAVVTAQQEMRLVESPFAQRGVDDRPTRRPVRAR